MTVAWAVIPAGLLYLSVLFAIAHWGDRRAAAGRSIISNGYIYALSIAVYATSWTYYGSVGSAASGGIAWLPIYLGPMVVVTVWWLVLRKIIRICKRDRITSLADFVSARYGKSQRAEPVAILFEQGRAKLGGVFAPRPLTPVALGIAVKIADGGERCRDGVVLDVLRQLGSLSAAEFEELADLYRDHRDPALPAAANGIRRLRRRPGSRPDARPRPLPCRKRRECLSF